MLGGSNPTKEKHKRTSPTSCRSSRWHDAEVPFERQIRKLMFRDRVESSVVRIDGQIVPFEKSKVFGESVSYDK